MACKCFDELKEKCEEALASHMTGVTHGTVEGSGEVAIEGRVFTFAEGDYSPIALKVKSSFRGCKKAGGPKANLTKLENMVRVKFCPLCGTEHTGTK